MDVFNETDVLHSNSSNPGQLDALLPDLSNFSLSAADSELLEHFKNFVQPNFVEPYPTLKKVVDAVNLFGTPVIIIVGLIGNSLAFTVFMCSHLRHQSSSMYLAFLNLADSGLLLCLFIVWLGWSDVRIFHTDGWCQIVTYATYVSAFLSAWIVVGFTVERYIVVYYPLQKHRLCTPKRARAVVACLFFIALVLYSFVPFTTGVFRTKGVPPICVPLPAYDISVPYILVADTILTMIIPSVIIIVLNVGITFRICNFVYHRKLRQAAPFVEMEGLVKNESYGRRTMQKKSSCTAIAGDRGDEHGPAQKQDICGRLKNKITLNSSKSNGCSGESSGGGGVVGGDGSNGVAENSRDIHSAQNGNGVEVKPTLMNTFRHNSTSANMSRRNHLNFVFTSTSVLGGTRLSSTVSSHTCVRHSYQIRTTRVLVMVSTFFLVLNMPSHIFRLYGLLKLAQDQMVNQLSLYVQQLLMMLYYSNFAVNMFLYCACSRSFRSSFKRLFNHWKILLQKVFRGLMHPCRYCCGTENTQDNKKKSRPTRV